VSGFTSAAGIELVVSDKIHRGWKDARIELGLEAVAAKVTLRLAERWAGSPAPRLIRMGEPFRLVLDGETVVQGFIDAVAPDYDAEDHVLTVTGRERTADLVDCAAVVDGPHEFRDLRLDEVCRRLCEPFKIPVRVECEVGRPFPRFAIEPGEQAWDAIERGCRQRAVLATGDGRGTLVLTRSGLGGDGAGAVVLGGPEGNIKRGRGQFDWSERHHLVVVRGQAEGGGGRAGGEGLYDVSGPGQPVLIEGAGTSGPQAPQGTLRGQGRATDPAVSRWRPLVILADAQGDGPGFQEQADWAVRRAAGASGRIGYTVPGWRGGSGALWRRNTLIEVSDAYLGLRAARLLVAAVCFCVSADGSFTELELADRDAFDILPEPSKNAGKAANGLMREGVFVQQPDGRFVPEGQAR
jgi:prophage tail gpP-like protein